jgi:hypothetical protein
MSHYFGTFVLVATVLLGILAIWRSASAPAKFARHLGLTISTPGGYNEIRAQYSGLFLAVTAICAASLAGTVPRAAAYVVLMVVFGGSMVGRLVSIALDGGVSGYGRTILALYAIDAAGLTLSFAALALERPF